MTRIRDSISEKESEDNFLNDDYSLLDEWKAPDESPNKSPRGSARPR